MLAIMVGTPVAKAYEQNGAEGGGLFLFKQKTAYERLSSLVGSEMCIRDSGYTAQG